MAHEAEMWLSVGAAASAAGVPRRNAFRWVEAGMLAVREIGSVRCIEVNALRRVAEARQSAKGAALSRAAGTLPRESPAPPPSAPAHDEEALLALAETLTRVEELLTGLTLRFDVVERALGIR